MASSSDLKFQMVVLSLCTWCQPRRWSYHWCFQHGAFQDEYGLLHKGEVGWQGGQTNGQMLGWNLVRMSKLFQMNFAWSAGGSCFLAALTCVLAVSSVLIQGFKELTILFTAALIFCQFQKQLLPRLLVNRYAKLSLTTPQHAPPFWWCFEPMYGERQTGAFLRCQVKYFISDSTPATRDIKEESTLQKTRLDNKKWALLGERVIGLTGYHSNFSSKVEFHVIKKNDNERTVESVRCLRRAIKSVACGWSALNKCTMIANQCTKRFDEIWCRLILKILSRKCRAASMAVVYVETFKQALTQVMHLHLCCDTSLNL